jgi:hypothetical protein
MNLPAASGRQIHIRLRFLPSFYQMKSVSFVVLCFAWLADMLLLSAIGPLGRHVTASMVLYGCGFFLLATRINAGVYLTLGLAAMCKYVSAVAIPFCWSRRAGWKVLTFSVPAVLFIPYLSAGSALFASLETFAVRMHYNPDAQRSGPQQFEGLRHRHLIW